MKTAIAFLAVLLGVAVGPRLHTAEVEASGAGAGMPLAAVDAMRSSVLQLR